MDAATWATLPDADPPSVQGDRLEFDHGCQFFRADAPEMQALVRAWCDSGWAARWAGRFGCLAAGDDGRDAASSRDFFGLPGDARPVYVGVGGMQRLPRALLAAAARDGNVAVRPGERVSGIARCAEASGGWVLRGVAGLEAYHDTVANGPAAAADAAGTAAARSVAGGAAGAGGSPVDGSRLPSAPEAPLLGTFDAVVLTDISSTFGSWHRASAGVPEAFAARVRPLFVKRAKVSRSLPVVGR